MSCKKSSFLIAICCLTNFTDKCVTHVSSTRWNFEANGPSDLRLWAVLIVLCLYSQFISENLVVSTLNEFAKYRDRTRKSLNMDSETQGLDIMNKKRTGYLSWDDYFMSIAFLSAMRSKDPVTQVGACIVNKQNKIVGIGYNGMPTGCDDDEFPWGRDSQNQINDKLMYVCHAEMNAILNKSVGMLEDCRLYVALFPCNECAKLIIQSGIKKIHYYSNKNWNQDKCRATRKMFDAAGVTYTQLLPSNPKITIDFESIDWDKKV